MKNKEFYLGITILLVTLISYRRMLIDYDYFLDNIHTFTFLGNMTMGIGLTSLGLGYFVKTSFQNMAMIAILILVVMLTLLRGSLFEHGIEGFLLHYLMPLLVIFDYLYLYKRYTPKYEDIFMALGGPLTYLGLVFIYGLLTDRYPYPFLNFKENTSLDLLFTMGILLFAFMSLFALVVFIKQKQSKFDKTKT